MKSLGLADLLDKEWESPEKFARLSSWGMETSGIWK